MSTRRFGRVFVGSSCNSTPKRSMHTPPYSSARAPTPRSPAAAPSADTADGPGGPSCGATDAAAAALALRAPRRASAARPGIGMRVVCSAASRGEIRGSSSVGVRSVAASWRCTSRSGSQHPSTLVGARKAARARAKSWPAPCWKAASWGVAGTLATRARSCRSSVAMTGAIIAVYFSPRMRCLSAVVSLAFALTRRVSSRSLAMRVPTSAWSEASTPERWSSQSNVTRESSPISSCNWSTSCGLCARSVAQIA